MADYPTGRTFEWEVIMKEFLIGAAGIVLAGAALAQTPVAQTAPAPQVAPMPPMGVDRVQTRDEVVTKVREHFAQLDKNRDGFLTKEEAESGRAAMKDHFRQRLGERREHRLEQRDPAQAFNRLDTNKDGTISRDEFAKGHEMRIERRIALKDGMTAVPGAPGGEGRRMHMHHMGGGKLGGHMFEMSDANKDGRVSLQEATDAAVRHFDMADANRDGRITPEERKQMRMQFIEKRRAPKAG
jgi:Ca2+-binding EF-hand superfamily protein